MEHLLSAADSNLSRAFIISVIIIITSAAIVFRLVLWHHKRIMSKMDKENKERKERSDEMDKKWNERYGKTRYFSGMSKDDVNKQPPKSAFEFPETYE